MAFADPAKGRVVLDAEGLQEVSLKAATTCQAGDLIGYNSGWVLADANGVYDALFVATATQPTAAGKVVVAEKCKIDFGSTCTATANDLVYASDTAGDYSASAGTSIQVVGRMITAQIAYVEPQKYGVGTVGIPVTAVGQLTGIALAATETAGSFNINLDADMLDLIGETTNNETETTEGVFQVCLPSNYLPGGAVKIRVSHRVVGAGTAGSCTCDVEVFKQDGNGAIGTDLCTTAAAATLDDTWTDTYFTVTPTGFVAGDRLNVVITTVVVESATADLTSEIDNLALICATG